MESLSRTRDGFYLGDRVEVVPENSVGYITEVVSDREVVVTFQDEITRTVFEDYLTRVSE